MRAFVHPAFGLHVLGRQDLGKGARHAYRISSCGGVRRSPGLASLCRKPSVRCRTALWDPSERGEPGQGPGPLPKSSFRLGATAPAGLSLSARLRPQRLSTGVSLSLSLLPGRPRCAGSLGPISGPKAAFREHRCDVRVWPQRARPKRALLADGQPESGRSPDHRQSARPWATAIRAWLSAAPFPTKPGGSL